jgi:hypothetical protein
MTKIIKTISPVFAAGMLLSCNPLEILNPEPDQHQYRVGKTHRNVAPFAWQTRLTVDDPNGNSGIGYVYSTDHSLISAEVTDRVAAISRYVTNSLKDLGQDQCPKESLINVYFVPKDTINDPEKMVFLTDRSQSNHKTFFGLTTIAMPFPITASYICSDCIEYTQEALIVHEIAHAWLSLCGDRESARSEYLPEMLEADYASLSLEGEH